MEDDIEFFAIEKERNYKNAISRLKSSVRAYLRELPTNGRELVSVQYSTSVCSSASGYGLHYVSAMVTSRAITEISHKL